MEGKWWKQILWIHQELMEGFQLLIASEIQHWCNMELVESDNYSFGSLKKKVGWTEPCWPRQGFTGRVGH